MPPAQTVIAFFALTLGILLLSNGFSGCTALRYNVIPAVVSIAQPAPMRQRLIHIVKVKRPDGVVEQKIFTGPQAALPAQALVSSNGVVTSHSVQNALVPASAPLGWSVGKQDVLGHIPVSQSYVTPASAVSGAPIVTTTSEKAAPPPPPPRPAPRPQPKEEPEPEEPEEEEELVEPEEGAEELDMAPEQPPPPPENSEDDDALASLRRAAGKPQLADLPLPNVPVTKPGSHQQTATISPLLQAARRERHAQHYQPVHVYHPDRSVLGHGFRTTPFYSLIGITFTLLCCMNGHSTVGR